MLTNKNQAFVSGLLGLGIAGFAGAVALPFNDRIEYRIGNRIESQPAWLVPPKAEFKGIERGYGGLKILLALLATGGSITVMLIARKEGELEPMRQRIKQYKNQAYEFDFAAESAFQMAQTQQRYKKLLEADEVAIEGEIEQAYLESMGIDPSKQQPALTGTATLDSVTNPGDKVQQGNVTPIGPETEPTGRAPLAQPSDGEGMAIIDGLVGSRRSLLLVGATGAGKSITEACMLTKFLQLYPAAEVWVIAQKNDSFCGLDKKGRVVLFDSLSPKSALSTIDRIHAVYDRRRRLPERARADLPPVRLILADWLSVNQALEESSKDEPVKGSKYLTKLTDIIYNGRELNVCLWVDLQSFNLAAIGLKADANSRKNFNLVGLGNYSVDEFGCINESYGVLANMIGNKYMVADEDERTALLADFRRLKQISQQHQRPIIFTTLEPARVALLPDLRHYKHQVKEPEPNPPSPDDRAYPERTYKLEFDLNTPLDSPADSPNLSDSQPRSEPDSQPCQDSDGHPEPLSGAVSGVSWNVRKVKEMYPNLTPDQLFESVSASAKAGSAARELIRSILKCGERSDHPTRSYTGHGKTLLRWLIENYDDGRVADLPEIKKFLAG